jgi:hypothetical protein
MSFFSSLGLPEVKTPTLAPYVLTEINTDPRFLAKLVPFLQKERTQELVENGFIDLDKAFDASNNQHVVTAKIELEKLKIKKPYCGRVLYLGLPRTNVNFKKGKGHTTSTTNGKFMGFVNMSMFKNMDFFPESLTTELGKLPIGDLPTKGKDLIETYFKTEGFTYSDISVFYTPTANDTLLKILSVVIKDEKTTCLSDEIAVLGFIGSKYGKNITKNADGTSSKEFSIQCDDIVAFRPPQ